MEPLKRELGFWRVALSGIGIILGAGIYVLVGKAAGMAGNAVWLSFLIGAVLAALTGLSYAELSALMPRAGAEYTYVRKAFGRFPSFVIGWLIVIGGMLFCSTVSLGFGGYFSALFGVHPMVAAAGLIAACIAVALMGIKHSTTAIVLMTLIEVSGLFIIIAVGVPFLGTVNYLEMPSFAGLMGAAALIFFAFIGFEHITRLSEETKNPTKTIPKALVAALLASTLIYVLVSVSAVGVISWETLALSEAPLAAVGMEAMGSGGLLLLSVIALFSTGNTALLLLIATARVAFDMGRSGSLPHVLGKVDKKRGAPWASTVILGLLAVAFLALGNLETVAGTTNFTVFVTFIAVNASVISMRYRWKARRPFRVPLSIGRFPVLSALGLAFSAALMLSLGIDAIVLGTAVVLSGIVAYAALRKRIIPSA